MSSEKGQSFVELVLILPILLVLMLGLIEIGAILHDYLVLMNDTREIGRLAARGGRPEVVVGYKEKLYEGRSDVSIRLSYISVATGQDNQAYLTGTQTFTSPGATTPDTVYPVIDPLEYVAAQQEFVDSVSDLGLGQPSSCQSVVVDMSWPHYPWTGFFGTGALPLWSRSVFRVGHDRSLQ